MKARLLTLIFIVLTGAGLHAQHTYTWQRTGMVMDLYFNAEEAVFEEGEEWLSISLNELELEFLVLNKDSVSGYFSSPYTDMLDALIQEYEVIVLSTPGSLPHVVDGSYILALDTFIFTDSIVIGAFSHPSSPFVILAVFDCYDSPLADALGIMLSIRFDEGLIRKE